MVVRHEEHVTGALAEDRHQATLATNTGDGPIGLRRYLPTERHCGSL